MNADRRESSEGNHYAFFAALGEMSEADERWTITVAGLVTLRLLDKCEITVHRGLTPAPIEIDAVRRAIDLATPSAQRAALMSVVDAVADAWGQGLTMVAGRVLAYAGVLYDEARWTLAADVYRTFLMVAATASDMELAAHAWVRLGTALSMMDELGQAERAYETGRALAGQQENRYMERLAEQGLTAIAIRRRQMGAPDRTVRDGGRRSSGTGRR